MFSAYLLDPEHGWHEVPSLTFDEAIQQCRDFRNDWAGSSVAVVPHGADPAAYFAVVLGTHSA